MADTGEGQLHFLDYWRVVKNRWGIITLTFLLVVVTAYITTYFLPREYYSKVVMEVKSDEYGMSLMSGQGRIQDNPDAKFAPTQYQILHSKEIINPVIDELRLRDKWAAGGTQLSKEQVFDRVIRMLDVKEVRGTDLLEIGVFSTEPQEAANVANTIAVQYQTKRLAQQHDMMTAGLRELDEEVTKQKAKVAAAETEVASIRQRLGLVDLTADDGASTDLAVVNDVRSRTTQLQETKFRVEELTTQLAQIDKMTPDELIHGLSILNIPEPTITKILPLYQDTIASELSLTNLGIGENHPRMKALKAQEALYDKQLHDQIDILRKELQSRLTIAQNEVAASDVNTLQSEQKMQENKVRGAEYNTAKNEYNSEKHLLETAQTRYQTEAMQYQLSFKPAVIWERAEPSAGPARPNVPMYMAIAFVVGLVWGVGLAFFLEYLDTSVKTLADVEKFIGVSVLAVVPKITGLLFKMDGRSPDAETYRTLRTNIDFHKPSPDANTITIISGGPGEGKSTTLSNLAWTYANAGNNVLIVDADLRRPSQGKFFGINEPMGLVNYVRGEVELEDIIKPTSVNNVWLISAGSLPKDPVAILNSHRMVELVGRTKAQFDVVLFDSPPILGLSDGSVLSSIVEMTVMVVQHRRFPRASLLRVKQAILNVGGNLTGVVLNRVDTRDDQNYYYYTSYYDYYAPTERDTEKSTREESEV